MGQAVRHGIKRYVLAKNIQKEVCEVAKDSQIDPKNVRDAKAKGGPTMANSQPDGEGRNQKKHSVKPQGLGKGSANR